MLKYFLVLLGLMFLFAHYDYLVNEYANKFMKEADEVMKNGEKAYEDLKKQHEKKRRR